MLRWQSFGDALKRAPTRTHAALNDAAGEQGIEVHGEVVDGGAAGFGNIFRAGAGLSVKKCGDVADFEFLF